MIEKTLTFYKNAGYRHKVQLRIPQYVREDTDVKAHTIGGFTLGSVHFSVSVRG